MTMIKPFQMFRMMQINFVLMRHAFTRSVIGSQPGILGILSYLNPFSLINSKKSRGESVRISLERLGPIFVKFGQLLSTRQDLLPEDIIAELTKLQDRVPPFPSKDAIKIIEEAFKKPIKELFARFDETPLASASIAQVHAAELHDGSKVIVKVLRPKIYKVIRHDIAILYLVAKLTERFWSQGKRLRPVELVAEFEQTILGELDLMREAANASQLRHNFIDSNIMYVPKIYWQFTRSSVMVMERIHGIQISDLEGLRAKNTNMKKLAENGVEIFFTQVFRDSFFHADMHPGNLFVDVTDPQKPKYIGVDFGIMGTLSPTDLHYLAANLLAFFNRDYRRVAVLHVQSGWVPVETRVDLFEAAIRTVCEPIFERPLREISFGQLLLRLFQTAERFNMEVQPQLMLLQKTLLSIESLGRMLYPDLDLWQTAKPFMINWMKKHQSLRRIFKETLPDFHEVAEKVLRMPYLAHDVLDELYIQQRSERLKNGSVNNNHKPYQKKKFFLFGSGLTLTIASLISFMAYHPSFEAISIWQWITGGVGLLFLLLAWVV